jgi:hypothetical protein
MSWTQSVEKGWTTLRQWAAALLPRIRSREVDQALKDRRSRTAAEAEAARSAVEEAELRRNTSPDKGRRK